MGHQMQRTTEPMDMHTTRRALEMVGKTQAEIGDTKVPGLSIRVRKTTATWCLRGRFGPQQSIWTVGPVARIPLTAARDRAIKAKDMLRNGTDPTAWLQEQLTGAPVERTFDPSKDGMTWEDGVAIFLGWIKRERRPATYDDYRKTLHGRDCIRFKGRLLKSITDDDIRQLRDDIDQRAPVQAQHTLRILKSCFAFLADTGRSGIKVSPAAAVKQRIRGIDQDDEPKLGQVPSVEDMGRLMWSLAEATNPTGRLAGALLTLTAQRVRTVCSARILDFEPKLDGGLWIIPRPYLKTRRRRQGRPHVIPLPPVTWHVVQQAIALAPAGSEWLFPQTRLRRVGDKGEGHISRNLVADAIRAGGLKVAPHDLRRAFGTHGEPFCGWTTAESKLVLDHDRGQTGDITAERYSLHNGEHQTWGMMRRWETWVLEQTRSQAPEGGPPLPAFLNLRSGAPQAAPASLES